MPNTFLTPDIIAREALMILQSNTVMAGLVYRDYEGEFTPAKVGDTITIRKPASFEAKEFEGEIELQDANEKGVTLTLEKHLDVSVPVSSKEWTLELDDFSTRIVAPAMVAINEKVDNYLCGLYPQFNQVSGTAGTMPSTLAALADLDKAMNEARVPISGRRVVVKPPMRLTTTPPRRSSELAHGRGLRPLPEIESGITTRGQYGCMSRMWQPNVLWWQLLPLPVLLVLRRSAAVSNDPDYRRRLLPHWQQHLRQPCRRGRLPCAARLVACDA
ncbi:MAG: P22 phage major capsid protein family protein [Desulfovibrio sp.]|uniref:P22 phage major capsid protein family protein n=1 Tax=Desulfovibrio sp. TaxID=885 RepID=UPI0039E4AAAA